MTDNPLKQSVAGAEAGGRRLVVPLLGFPGLSMVGSTVKIAQQNYGEHFKVVRKLAEEFQPDLILPLMDLAVEANALGRHTVFPKSESATVVKDEFTPQDRAAVAQVNVSFDTRLQGYVETLKLMGLGLPAGMLRGAYVVGPYTLAALLMGADEAAMATILKPEELLENCRFTTEVIQQYTRMLIGAGAQVICVLEPSAVMLGPDIFWQFSSQFVRHIVESCCYTGVSTIYHTCGNTMHLLEKMAESGVDGVSLDSPDVGVDLPEVARRLPESVVVIGNINPTGAILSGTPEQVEHEVVALLDAMTPYPNFVLSTGCDLPQETPLNNIRAFMRAGRNH